MVGYGARGAARGIPGVPFPIADGMIRDDPRDGDNRDGCSLVAVGAVVVAALPPAPRPGEDMGS